MLVRRAMHITRMVDQSDRYTSITQSGRDIKVDRVIRDYDLFEFGIDLERRWLGIDGDRESLRDLADAFNQRVLKVALREVGEQPVDGEIENHYRLLTADDVTTSERAQIETRLSRQGIDVETVKRDFVSHQAIHTYLTEVRGASLPSDESPPETIISNRREAILRLRNRLVAVAERSLDSLRQAGHLSLGEFDVMVRLTVYCNDCGTSADITDLLNRGECACRDDNH